MTYEIAAGLNVAVLFFCASWFSPPPLRVLETSHTCTYGRHDVHPPIVDQELMSTMKHSWLDSIEITYSTLLFLPGKYYDMLVPSWKNAVLLPWNNCCREMMGERDFTCHTYLIGTFQLGHVDYGFIY